MLERSIVVATLALILSGITLVQASELTKITVTIIGEAVIILDSDQRMLRAYVEFENYDPHDGHSFMKVVDSTTGYIIKESEILPRKKTADMWGTQIAYFPQENEIKVGEYEIQIITQFGSAIGKTSFSVIDKMQPPKTETADDIPIAKLTSPASVSAKPTEISIPSGISISRCENTNECFVPYEVTVDIGGEVTWTNNDSVAHTVNSGTTEKGRTGIFDSSLFMPGNTISYTFENSDTFPYFCSVHPWMKGVIIVGDGIKSEPILTENVYQTTVAKAKGLAANMFGSNTKKIVCGNKLCSETQDKRPAFQSEKEGLISNSVEVIGEPIKENQCSVSVLSKSLHEEMLSNENSSDIYNFNTEIEEIFGNHDVSFSNPTIPVTIPLHRGFFDGQFVFFIITDSSDLSVAMVITGNQCWKVQHAPLLSNIPKEASSTIYVFANGVTGNGIFGFQQTVFTNAPSQFEQYSSLGSVVQVDWKSGFTPKTLESEKLILRAEKEGKLTLRETPIVLNLPQVIWPGGQIPVKDDKSITDETSLVGGQVVDIDFVNSTITFIAHRAWGPNGEDVYFIATDATPSAPAEALGVPHSPKTSILIENTTSSDRYVFKNGVEGPGLFGFQPSVTSGIPDSEHYSPMSRIFLIEWNEPEKATLITTLTEINTLKTNGLIDVRMARPMDANNIVNLPIVDINLKNLKIFTYLLPV